MNPLHDSFPDDAALRGRRVLVMGLGLFGGGAAVVRFLVSRGAIVRVTDLRDARSLAPTLAALADLGDRAFETVLGEHRRDDFAGWAEFVVVNPAVPPDSPWLAAAAARGVPRVSEVGLCLARLRARLAFVTGSKGKTTTTALLHAMARRGGIDAVLGGNIGAPLLDRVDEIRTDQLVVFEVSSFQLEQLRGLERRPEVAVVTNLFPIHLDRHGSFAEYVAAKAHVLEGARAAVLHRDDPESRRLGAGFGGEVDWFGTVERPAAASAGLALDGVTIRETPVGRAVFTRDELRIPGVHNTKNAMAAWLAARRLGVAEDAARAALRAFPGVEHRLETVAEAGGVRWVDDSIATSPRAVLAALEALAPLVPGRRRPGEATGVVLLAGGQDSGVPLDDWMHALVGLASATGAEASGGPILRALIVFGAAAARLAEAARAAGLEAPIDRASDLDQAAAFARARARSGDVVLLSPGFPSYDQFLNFRERGERFARLAIQGPG